MNEVCSVENGEEKRSPQKLIAMIENARFEAVERDSVYDRVEKVAVIGRETTL